MARVFPCDSFSSRAPTYYTYYVIMTFLVIFLAVTLIWLPFLQLITEFSTVVSKVITFLDANFLEHDGDCFFDNLASFLVNERFLIIASAVSMGFLIFLASGDFLIFAACYVGNLPNRKGLETISNKANPNQAGDEIECDYVSGTNYGTNKLVLVVRTDLKMGKGKVAAQCSHAAVMAHEASRKKCPDIFYDWKRNGQPKIVVKVDNEDEMLDLAMQAKKHQLLVNIVQDAGRTQVASGSRTVLAVGPGSESVINEVTGHLKLY